MDNKVIRWNKYAEVDGLMDIVETSTSIEKPKGKGWHKAPTKKIDWSTVNPNIELAFPSAHNNNRGN